MRKWWIKAFIQKIISYLPFNTDINSFFQKKITKQIDLTDHYFFDRLEHARDHLNYYIKYSKKEIPGTCLEIGTGWYPTIPISFFLAGSETIYSVDISFLTTKEKIAITIEKFIESNENGMLKKYINVKPERIAILQEIYKHIEKFSLDEILKKLKIVYLIEDARKLSLTNDTIDLICSNNTFEHIYPTILKPIFKELKRVIKKEVGIMSHIIDMSDHFAHFDKTINIYNFLKFSNFQWKIIDNSIAPQSRLRYYEYKEIYKKLDIPINYETAIEGDINQLNTINLDSRFGNKLMIQTAYSSCHLISIF